MIKQLLQKRSVYYMLLGLNLAVILAVFYMSGKAEFPDEKGYINMADSFSKGTFSSWYFLPYEIPETLRTWGYPFFIFLIQSVFHSIIAVKITQLLMYAGALFLILDLMKRFNPGLVYRNVFLLIILPNFQLAYYTGQIAAECVNIFFLVLFAYVYFVRPDTYKKMLWLTLLAFIIYQLRPSFLLFPFFLLMYKLLFERKNIGQYILFSFLFSLSLLPFGFWNLKHHGVFKVTPLEGGAGAAHLGYWCFKLPDNYISNFYWGSIVVPDITKPAFYSGAEKNQWLKEYEEEWGEMNKKLKPFFSAKDSVIEQSMDLRYGQVRLYNSGYTKLREKLLTQSLIANIKKDPWFYCKTRVYTLGRMWFTGINPDKLAAARGTIGKIQVIYPFAVSFVFIFLGLVLVCAGVCFKWIRWKKYSLLFLLILYFALAHLPFLVQGRYTVPVHIFILFLLSVLISQKLSRDKKQVNSGADHSKIKT
ncbi:MAG: hypothetical protein WDN26_23225 [Chitinophagaceae bacterium]